MTVGAALHVVGEAEDDRGDDDEGQQSGHDERERLVAFLHDDRSLTGQARGEADPCGG
jgi:hypothetical protein